MVNTIIKSKKLKSIIDDIKKEQLDNKLTNIERLEDWEERFINQTEQLHQVEKDLKENIDKLEGAKDKLEKAKETYISVIANKLKEQEELEERIKALEEKNESQEIALLKEIHQRELKELQDTIELRKPIYRLALESASNSIERIKELEKELEEKEKKKELEEQRAAKLRNHQKPDQQKIETKEPRESIGTQKEPGLIQLRKYSIVLKATNALLENSIINSRQKIKETHKRIMQMIQEDKEVRREFMKEEDRKDSDILHEKQVRTIKEQSEIRSKK